MKLPHTADAHPQTLYGGELGVRGDDIQPTTWSTAAEARVDIEKLLEAQVQALQESYIEVAYRWTGAGRDKVRKTPS